MIVRLGQPSRMSSDLRYGARMSRTDERWPDDPVERRAFVGRRIRLLMVGSVLLVVCGVVLVAFDPLGMHKFGLAVVGLGVAAIIALFLVRRSLHLIGQTSDDLPR